MATPRGAKHTDLEQRLRDIEAKLRAVARNATSQPSRTIFINGSSVVSDFWNTDTVNAGSDNSTVLLDLTYTPNPGSLHVRKNGLDLAATEWALSGARVTIAPTSLLTVRTGDRFDAEYKYDAAAPLPVVPVGSFFDEVMARSPILFHRFNGSYLDSSGNGATLTPGPGNAFVSSIIPTDPGGSAADFSAPLSYAYSGTPVTAIDALSGSFSFVAPARYVDAGVDGYFIGQLSPAGGGNIHFLIGYAPATQEVTVRWYDGSAHVHTLDASGTFNVDTLFGITADGTNVILYVNGVPVDSVAQSGAPISQVAGHYVCVGSDGATNNRLRGRQDDSALFDTALSPADHMVLAQAGGFA
jgi:hypothetical protein